MPPEFIGERIVGERLGHVVKMMLPFVDLGEPDVVLLLLHTDKKRLNDQLGVAENVFVHLDVFVDFCFVDFELHNLCLLAKALAVTCHTVGEPRADGDNQVARSRHHAGFVAAVHADVADTQRMACRNTAQTHQRTADRRVDQLCKLSELLAGVRAENAAAGINHRAARFADKRLHTRDGIGIGDGVRLGRFGMERLKLGDHGGDVLGDVYQNRTLSAAAGKLERLANGNIDNVNLLKAVASELVEVDVGGNGNKRNAVDIRGGKSGNNVGRAGARGGEHHAGLAGRTRVAVRRVRSALFVGGQNMLDFVAVLVERVVGIERRAAGIAEYGVNALLQ